MKIYAGSRQSGKTTKLILECAEKDGVIMCSNAGSAAYIMDTAKKMGVKIRKPVTTRQFLKGKLSKEKGVKLFIDDAELFLKGLCKKLCGKDSGLSSVAMYGDNVEVSMREFMGELQL